VTPDAGRVALGGEDVTGRPLHRLAARGLVRSFQKTAVFGTLSLVDNLVAAGRRAPSAARSRRSPSAAPPAAHGDAHARALACWTRSTGAAGLGAGGGDLVRPAEAAAVRVLPHERATPRLLDDRCRRQPAAGRAHGGPHPPRHGEARTAFVIIEHNTDALLGLCARVVVLRADACWPPARRSGGARRRVVEAYLGALMARLSRCSPSRTGRGYGPMRIVDGVDLDVYAGDLLAILGPNGAGK